MVVPVEGLMGFYDYRGEFFKGSAILLRERSDAHLGSETGRLALDFGRLEICGRDGRLEFSGPEDRLRAGIDEVNVQPVATVLIHAPEPE
jgi:hypothetical protein